MRLKYLNLISVVFLFCSCSDKKNIFESNSAITKNTDSLEYRDIMINYGFYWQNISDSTKNILFDNYNGKMIVFKNYEMLNKKSLSDNVFTFEIDSINKYKLIGNYGFMDRDTVMYWTFDSQNKVLIDNKGEKFKQIKITK
ncbi:hypothetical protein [Flavobacterium sp.]|uniref:hypothetical protein n=1 Tax=Flavobacterium sp. TaxID=239 RepID=UPI004047D21C